MSGEDHEAELVEYFPKFGTRTGKEAVGTFIQRLLGQVQSLQHYPDVYSYIAAGDVVVAEGFESGVAKDGGRWPAGAVRTGASATCFASMGI